MTVTLSRRAILAGAAGAPVALALPALAATMSGSVSDRRSWEVAVATWRACDAKLRGACEALDKMESAFWKAEAAVPPPLNQIPAIPRQPGETVDEWWDRAEREYHASRARHERRIERLKSELRFDEVSDAHVASCDAEIEAFRALIRTPVPDIAALALKLELIRDENRVLDEFDLAALAADAQRLAGKAVAHA